VSALSGQSVQSQFRHELLFGLLDFLAVPCLIFLFQDVQRFLFDQGLLEFFPDPEEFLLLSLQGLMLLEPVLLESPDKTGKPLQPARIQHGFRQRLLLVEKRLLDETVVLPNPLLDPEPLLFFFGQLLLRLIQLLGSVIQNRLQLETVRLQCDGRALLSVCGISFSGRCPVRWPVQAISPLRYRVVHFQDRPCPSKLSSFM
jgi:hypothetical protein